MAEIKISPENIERAKTLRSMKWTIDKIARNMGVNDKTIRRWLDKSDDPAISTELSEARLTNHKVM